jgi:dienelactone hydrolase
VRAGDVSESSSAERRQYTEVLLLHHALGRTRGVLDFADTLRRAGHTVHAPDLFEGRTLETIGGGIGCAQEAGFQTIIERGALIAEALPAGLVYAGFSLGVLPPQVLAQTRAGSRGALLFYSFVPVSEFGGTWPDGVPLQVHGMDADPIFVGDGDLAAAMDVAAPVDDCEVFLYRGDQHHFADSNLPSHDAAATRLLMERVIEFLNGVS